MADIGSTFAGGAIGVGGTLLGVAINFALAGRRENRRFRVETALELAGTERLIWDETANSYVEMRAHLQRADARLSESGVSQALRSGFACITASCWAENHASLERTDKPGINTTLLEAREKVLEAMRAVLLRNASPRRRRAMARRGLAAVRDAIPTFDQAVEDSLLFL
jgi:hypothetical protein